ncbi:putative immunoglobulin-blocking virulence protein [Mesomycoplasma lagogenitalium]|uniref:Immunoglobulin-blocking virulence protein n=1 Tax=Mesomycoplasma lagogenitalium TaxID=171286 RepID=A0ABY8LUS3_9BACT|nr:putative immunoglobulin-blocking virulence protein [Mesomycoplasma lagogenitalium]WGI36999.1 putative immunoglobulin-blocking virulence protein [Mesomycoplasma lagogenitalium]
MKHFLKKSKNRKMIGTIAIAAVVPASVSSLLYFATTSSENSVDKSKLLKDNTIKLNAKNNLDFSDGFISSRDNNQQEIKKEEKVEDNKQINVEKPVEKEEVQKPEEKKETLVKETAPSPKFEEVQPEELTPPPPVLETAPTPEPTPEPKPNPSPNLGDGNIEYLKFGNLTVKAIVKRPKERVQSQNDIDKGITNREEYRAQVISEVVSIEVTEEVIKQNTANSVKGLSILTAGAWQNTLNEYKKMKPEDLKDFLKVQQFYWPYLLQKYKRLLQNGDKVYEFLTDEGKKIYYSELKPIKEDEVRWAKIIAYIDQSKFTTLRPEVLEFLAEGKVIEPDNQNIYVDENGNLGSWSYSPLLNTVQARLIKDNSEKRVFGNSGYRGRYPANIGKGVYDGWTAKDITSDQRFQNYNISKADGFTISELTRNEPIEGKRNQGIVVEIDMANASGYAKTLKFIKQAKENNLEITTYRFRNIGSKDANQRFYEIFKELPEHLPQLELFFESKNTSALIALENKKIDELSLLSTGDQLSDQWSINPWALKNVAWVNTVDYTSGVNYGKPVPGRIVFDSLAFEESDVGANKNLDRINAGLRMAYWVRNNEGIFQGSFGGGVNPDYEEKGNSYPIGIDLSRVPSLKTLRGLQFNDIEKPQNGSRKLKRIVLFNSGGTYELDTDELNNAQFTVLDTTMPQMPRSKIIFSNGSETKKIKIVSTKQTKTINSEGIRNLDILLNFNDGNFGSNTVFLVNKGDSALYNQLKSLGKNVQYDTSDSAIDFL